ncbi:uncharacterized protein ColSpa_05541 [Colletotrichum spaethianum]|uniref:SET domain-containing protein n=1 Tax=Colletotrichum spaethianum TaxID=700344 RepID=A0AA37LF03_9PEZI|nr:uncharacterized protein ColSpa_05541 [Colletotrichum spaethianum]GKT45360.1 hypothetical protein ColSpa_05541 [Colletotrichum spaethianum]
MWTRVLLAAVAFGHARGLKPQHPIFESCAASPLLPDSQIACGKGTVLTSTAPTLDRLAANRTAKGPKKDIWRSDEGWHGPHACAGVYCVYSRPSFASGRGIVLVSTAYNAEEASHLSAFATDSIKGEGDSELFRVVEMPGKGLGLVANQPIRRGQRIMAHPPAVVVHRRFVDEIDLEGQYRLLDVAAAQLPEETRKAFMAQMGQAAAHKSTGQKVHDIMHTNSFELGLRIKDGHHFGNYPEVSRFNHDCRPKMWEIEQQLSHWNGEKVDEEMIEQLITLYRQEQLDQSHGSDAFRLAALNYNSLGMEEEALRYAKLAEEQLLLERGPWSKQVKDMRDLLQDPKAHYSWRQRV